VVEANTAFANHYIGKFNKQITVAVIIYIFAKGFLIEAIKLGTKRSILRVVANE
jgi:hypothetical protein